LADLRQAVGLRRMVAVPVPGAATGTVKVALPVFKQYREADGQFYFKLSDAHGRVLLQSQGFAGGREAGEWVKRLKTEGAAVMATLPARLADGVTLPDLVQALSLLQATD
jgi:tryptophanyl-tRNA synthetase